jgi:hypothetical protein
VPDSVPQSAPDAKVEKPPGPPSVATAADRGSHLEQSVKTAAQLISGGVQAVASAAAQVSGRVYFAVFLRLVGVIFLFVVYQTIEAEGLRELFGEVVGKRLSKASSLFLGWMDNYKQTYKLDMANALATAFLVFTYLSWEAVVYRVVHRPEGESLTERYLLLVPAVVLLVLDGILFGVGVHANGSPPLPAVLLTLAYSSMLILFSFWVVKIERRRS